MYRPRATRQFKKDRNRLRKRGCDLDALTEVMRKLVAGERLGPEHRPHTLHGEFAGGMVELPLIVTRDDGARQDIRWFADRDFFTGGRRDDPLFDFSGPAVEYAKAVETELNALLFLRLRRRLETHKEAGAGMRNLVAA